MTKFVAHRGHSYYERENTVASFKKAAINDGFFGIETDCRKTVDGVYVLSHDSNISRVSNGKYDVEIEKTSYKDLREMLLPSLDKSFGRSDLYFPKMEEYFEICSSANKKAIFELKEDFSKEELGEILSIIDKYKWTDNTIFISFNIYNLIRLREIREKLELEWLTQDWPDKMWDTLIKYNMGLDIYYEYIDVKMVKKCHENNLKINCWTVDNKDSATQLMLMGVDYITSNKLTSKDF